MRLSKIEMERLAEYVLKRLLSKKLVSLKAPEKEVMDRIYDEIEKDVLREHELDQEVERILDAHASSMGENVNRRKLFMMIKNKLAKERGIVL